MCKQPCPDCGDSGILQDKEGLTMTCPCHFPRAEAGKVSEPYVCSCGKPSKTPVCRECFDKGLLSGNTIPRRNNLLQNVPVELAIRKAMQEVEKLPADIRLTNAVIKLDEALNFVADFIDETLK